MNSVAKGMLSCRVCGRDFPLIFEKHYISRGDSVSGIATIVSSTEPPIWDSFDCPHCGCQNNVQQRNRVMTLMKDREECDESEEE